MSREFPEKVAQEWNDLKHHMKNEVTETYVRIRFAATLAEPLEPLFDQNIQNLQALAAKALVLASTLREIQSAWEVPNV